MADAWIVGGVLRERSLIIHGRGCAMARATGPCDAGKRTKSRMARAPTPKILFTFPGDASRGRSALARTSAAVQAREGWGRSPAAVSAEKGETVPRTLPRYPQWTFLANTSKGTVDADIPATVPTGSNVWLTAFWFNARKQSSRPAAPQSTSIGGGMAMAA
jgi:hypothetical protein